MSGWYSVQSGQWGGVGCGSCHCGGDTSCVEGLGDGFFRGGGRGGVGCSVGCVVVLIVG